MDFGLSDDQRLLQETVSRFVADRYALDQRKGYLANEAGHDPAVAAELDELGLSLVQVPEDLGGLGGDAFDALVVGEALGPGLVLEPVLDAMTAVCALGQGAPEVLETASAHTLALFERGQRHSLTPVGCRVDDGGRLSGEKTLVANVTGLSHALVSALDEAGAVGLYRVALDADGVTRFDYPLQDGRPFADLRLEAVPATRIEGVGLAEIEAANARRVIAECAMAVGTMQAATDMTREYLSVRKQFGRPLAAFQALQFRLVDMNMEVQDARSMAIWAANQANLQSGDALLRAASMAKAKIGRAATLVAEESIQLHGGMGMTLDYGIGAYAKSLTTFNLLNGDVGYHTARVMRLAA